MIKELIVNLIREYQEAVAQGIKCLNAKYLENPIFHKATNDGQIQRHGFIEFDEKTYYEFHGISGCYIKWQDGKSVDFNLGIAGRCDGFDPWFVLDFYKSNSDVNAKYPKITIEDINQVIKDLMDSADLVEDNFNHLYFFKEDYYNPNPFRWAGGEYPSEDYN